MPNPNPSPIAAPPQGDMGYTANVVTNNLWHQDVDCIRARREFSATQPNVPELRVRFLQEVICIRTQVIHDGSLCNCSGLLRAEVAVQLHTFARSSIHNIFISDGGLDIGLGLNCCDCCYMKHLRPSAVATTRVLETGLFVPGESVVPFLGAPLVLVDFRPLTLRKYCIPQTCCFRSGWTEVLHGRSLQLYHHCLLREPRPAAKKEPNDDQCCLGAARRTFDSSKCICKVVSRGLAGGGPPELACKQSRRPILMFPAKFICMPFKVRKVMKALRKIYTAR